MDVAAARSFVGYAALATGFAAAGGAIAGFGTGMLFDANGEVKQGTPGLGAAILGVVGGSVAAMGAYQTTLAGASLASSADTVGATLARLGTGGVGTALGVGAAAIAAYGAYQLVNRD